jgi:hypothetical protein
MLMTTPWLGFPGVYAEWYRWVGNHLCQDLPRGGYARIVPVERLHERTAAHEGMDLSIGLFNGSKRTYGQRPISTRIQGLIPTALLVALVAATPIPLRRRAWALLSGTLLVQTYVFLRLALLIADAFCARSALALFDPLDSVRTILSLATEALVASTTTSLLAPLVIWIAVSLRRTDWPLLAGAVPGVGRAASSSGKPEPAALADGSAPSELARPSWGRKRRR